MPSFSSAFEKTIYQKLTVVMQMSKIKVEILKELGVTPTESFDVKVEIKNRVDFLANYLLDSGRKGFVLGLSGGVDSTAAGRLAQLAVEKLRSEGHEDVSFTAVRLPYSIQKDEADAQKAVDFVSADQCVTANIMGGVNGILGSLPADFLEVFTEGEVDFGKGNTKARVRMATQYLIAGLSQKLVIGTDHSAEAIMGFYTLHGDGAADILPLSGLNKRQVRLLAKELGAPNQLWNKPATADLEDLNEHLLDEVALGVTYDEIDDYLEGKSVSIESEKIIESRFLATAFKRRMPLAYR